MRGGTMSGNCATGMRVIAIAPAMVMTMAMTMARRGRAMKTLEIMTPSSPSGALLWRCRLARRRPAGRRGLARRRCGRHRLSRPHALNAVDDHRVALVEAVGDDRHGRRRLAELDALLLCLVVAIDGIDIVALLIRKDGGARHGQRLDRLRLAHDHGDELGIDQLARDVGALRGRTTR